MHAVALFLLLALQADTIKHAPTAAQCQADFRLWRNDSSPDFEVLRQTAAGLLKDDANLRRVKSAWRKLTPTERREFETWWKEEKKKRTSA